MNLVLYGSALVLGVAFIVFPLVALFWLPLSTVNEAERFIAVWPVGVGVGLMLFKAQESYLWLKADRWVRYLPARIELLDSGSAMWTVSVTRNDGERMIVDVPEGYTPDTDGGLLIVDLCCPEIQARFPKEYEMFKDSAMDWGLMHLLRQETVE